MRWVPLHVHSQYSILESTASIEDLAATAAKLSMGALALTDQGNLYGAVEFFKACKAQKVKSIIGCELFVAPGSRTHKKRVSGVPHGFPLVLLAKNMQGYLHLCKLSSIAHLEGFYYTPRIDKEILALHSEGLICLSGSLEGRIPTLILQEREEELHEELRWHREVFKEDFYLEVQRHKMRAVDISNDGLDKEQWAYQNYLQYVENQEKVTTRLRQISKELGIPCVATNDSRYIDREDWKAHEILLNIQSGEPREIWEKDSFGNPKARVLNPKRQIMPTHELHFKSSEEMEVLFADFPEAIATSAAIADQCAFEFDFKTKYYPEFIPPQLEGKSFTSEERAKGAELFLKELCEEGIKKRYT